GAGGNRGGALKRAAAAAPNRRVDLDWNAVAEPMRLPVQRITAGSKLGGKFTLAHAVVLLGAAWSTRHHPPWKSELTTVAQSAPHLGQDRILAPPAPPDAQA